MIFETVKAVILFYVIFESFPFTKLSNKLLMKLRPNYLITHLLECGFCIVFWISLCISVLSLSTTPVAVAMLTAMILEKINK
jgi:hypothetical protein